MRIHYMQPWVPVLSEPLKKLAKPRKFFVPDDVGHSADPNASAPRPSDILNEDMQEKRTDILA